MSGTYILYPNYQPQINSCSEKFIGLEALVRWEHPTMGFLTPAQFIPLAEETGMIVEVDRWIMSTAMMQISHWYSEGLNPGILGLNISMKHLESNDFIELIQENIQTHGFKAEWLELEITEGQMMTKTEEVISKLRQINDLGVGIAIDDFGTGYSSLSLLKRLPIHRLKIDQSFIQDIPDDEEDIAIVRAIIALANSLNLELVAEGVETMEQKKFLIDNGCINMQGYYFSHPVSAEEIKEILLSQH
jgi:EAL domain-containing protein (putative c-di-GMP-specific phosphodiesterase class I)